MDPTLASSLPVLVWAIFIGATLLSLTLGTILAYHWFRYAMNPAASFSALVLFSCVSVLLLSTLLAATVAIATI